MKMTVMAFTVISCIVFILFGCLGKTKSRRTIFGL